MRVPVRVPLTAPLTATASRRALALGFAALMVPALAACGTGPTAATSNQEYSGNGFEYVNNSIQVSGATLVAGDPGSGKAAFLGTVFNPTEVEDELISIQAGTSPAKIVPETIKVPPMQAVSIQTGKAAQATFADLTVKSGGYVPVTITFKTAGATTFPALLVPPTDYYFAAAPEGTSEVKVKVADEVDKVAEEIAGGEAAQEGAVAVETDPLAH